MAEVTRRLISAYKLVFDEWTDPRTRDWFLVAKPYQGILLLGVYLMFVLKWGPRWMKNRPAFNMDRVIIAYNTFQVIACAWLFIKSLRAWGRGGSYKWICEPVGESNSDEALFVANLVYYYFLLKIIDLLDTVFFVLRKKSNQVSFLHVYHHTGMVSLIWGAVTYLPGGHGTSVGVVNSIVHVVMYSYYLVTIMFPRIKNLIWVKKLVTQLQLIQFLLFVLHIGVIIFLPDCQYPRWTVALFLPQNLFMLILFTDFYIKTYIRKPKSKNALNTQVSKSNKSNDDDDDKSDVEFLVEKESDKDVSNGKVEYLIRNQQNYSTNSLKYGATSRKLHCT